MILEGGKENVNLIGPLSLVQLEADIAIFQPNPAAFWFSPPGLFILGNGGAKWCKENWLLPKVIRNEFLLKETDPLPYVFSGRRMRETFSRACHPPSFISCLINIDPPSSRQKRRKKERKILIPFPDSLSSRLSLISFLSWTCLRQTFEEGRRCDGEFHWMAKIRLWDLFCRHSKGNGV